MPVFWFFAKLMVLLFGTVWLRASLPRLRYDQLMDLGWKWLIELSFLAVMVTGVVIVARDQGWTLDRRARRVRRRRLVLGLLRLCMPRRDESVSEVV